LLIAQDFHPGLIIYAPSIFTLHPHETTPKPLYSNIILFEVNKSMAGFFSNLKSIFSNTSNHSSTPIDLHGDSLTIRESSLLSGDQAQDQFYNFLFPVNNSEATLTVPQKLVLNVLKTKLANEEALKAVPRLPSVIPRLLKSLRDPEASGKDFVEIINKDPAMSAAVLKLANSVYFNPHEKRVDSIEIAVVKLGIEGLRSVLSAAVMHPVIQYESDYFSEFGHKLWDHALCCAVACENIAKPRGLEPFKAYLLGLVHDIGKLLIFSELCQQYKLNPGDEIPNQSAFAPLMKSLSSELSYRIAQAWEMPEEISSALKQQANLKDGDRVGPYGHLLFQANLACEAYAIGRENRIDGNHPYQHLLEDLSLPHDLFEKLESLKVQV